jgi:psp operon transcriptional activator
MGRSAMVEPSKDLDPLETHRPGGQEALGQCEVFLDFQKRLSRAAKVNRPVLLVGERGTGKELAASRVHRLSQRWAQPFVALNCSALPASLIESELFGHEAGAFTGATGRRTGRFEAADGGTLFLDEIGNIPIEVQEKILRVVEYGAFERVGSSHAITVDVRIIAATNADLRAMVRDGHFMNDLLDRLSFEVLIVPSLRRRVEDIALLANHFAARMAFDMGWSALPEITDDAMEKLECYDWPGNVRELKNVVERAVYRSDDTLITHEEIIFDPFEIDEEEFRGVQHPQPAQPQPPAAQPTPAADSYSLDLPFNDAVRNLEICLARAALEKAQYNQRKAAEALGLSYHQFRTIYRKYAEELRTG